MSPRTVQELKDDAAEAGRDPQSRKLILLMAGLALVSLIVAVGAGWSAWNAADEDAQAGQDLAAQVQAACEDPAIMSPDIEALCKEDAVEDVINGTPGEAGAVGLTGPEGPIGPPGLFGATGAQGLTGPRGDTGPRGSGGNTGANGAAGTPGEDGSAGEDGASGSQGEPGPPGEPGAAGPQGPSGERGADGTSAYPFTFQFTAQTSPVESTTYTVTCRPDGCAVESSSSTAP